MEENQYKFQIVFFDAGGTIFEVNGGVGDIYSRFARSHGVETEPEKIQQRFVRSFRLQPPLAFPGVKSERELHQVEYEWWRKLARDVFAEIDFPRFDQFFGELFEFFRSREAWRLFDDVEPTLEALKADGLRLAVISNFDSRIDDLLQAFKIDHYFGAVHISSRIGAAKPDPLIFHAALQHQAVEARHALHIGDSWREDVEGASAVGIKSILLDRNNDFADNPRAPRITNLYQLVELL